MILCYAYQILICLNKKYYMYLEERKSEKNYINLKKIKKIKPERLVFDKENSVEINKSSIFRIQ